MSVALENCSMSCSTKPKVKRYVLVSVVTLSALALSVSLQLSHNLDFGLVLPVCAARSLLRKKKTFYFAADDA